MLDTSLRLIAGCGGPDRSAQAFAVLLMGAVCVASGQAPAAEPTYPPAPATRGAGAGPAPGDMAALPTVLSAEDVALYRRILAAQGAGDTAKADQLMKAVENRLLVGVVLAKRYLETRYHPSNAELAAWLRSYGDEADAPRIHELAARSQPAVARPHGRHAARRPVAAALPAVTAAPEITGSGAVDLDWRDRSYQASGNLARAERLAEEVRHALGAAGPAAAAKLLDQAMSPVDPVFLDGLRGEVAAAYLQRGQDREALALAAKAARSSPALPHVAWTAGLAAWRLGQKDAAAAQFEAAAASPAASPASAARGAYWAARAHLANRHFDAYETWLRRAAARPYVFYGLLAREALGIDSGFDWRLPPIEAADRQALRGIPGVARALALLQLGEHERAEAELRRAVPRLAPRLMPAALTVASEGGMPSLAMYLATWLSQRGGKRIDAGFYPVPAWRPAEGFRVDRALVYAIARHESHFMAQAKNPSGATGLLQLMPQTARALGQSEHRLTEPASNIAIGQRLIEVLLAHERVTGNLADFLVAYGSGVGTLSRLQDDRPRSEDPLLYIETTPSPAMRLFTEEVMTDYWIYQSRLGQMAGSLTALAANEWPIYGQAGPGTQLSERSGFGN